MGPGPDAPLLDRLQFLLDTRGYVVAGRDPEFPLKVGDKVDGPIGEIWGNKQLAETNFKDFNEQAWAMGFPRGTWAPPGTLFYRIKAE
jgi:hypothetical protein